MVLELVATGPDGYSLTELGAFLRTDSPGSRRAWARLMAGEFVWRAWGKLTECVRTGKPAFAAGDERASDTETFDVLFNDAAAAEVFHQAMADGTRGVARDVIAAIDFAGVRRVVDVGGGYGELLCAALEAHPQIQGEVFDLEHARPGAVALVARRGLAARGSFAADLFRDEPPAADLLLMKSVIHDWDDDRSLTILEHCRAAMDAGSRVVIVEPPAAPPGAAVPPSFAWIVAFSDLNMLVNTGGRERTAAQYTALLARARLRVVDVRATAGGFYSCFVCEKEA